MFEIPFNFESTLIIVSTPQVMRGFSVQGSKVVGPHHKVDQQFNTASAEILKIWLDNYYKRTYLTG